MSTQPLPPWWELPLDAGSSEPLFSVCERALIAVSLIKGLKRSQVGKRLENEQERGILKVNESKDCFLEG